MQIHVIGLGVAQNAALSLEALTLIRSLTKDDRLVGSERQLKTVFGCHSATPFILPKLSELKEVLTSWKESRVKRVVVLASGDPLFYGIGSWVKCHFSHLDVTYYPNVSSIQSACHQSGVSLQDAHVVSVHGRPLASLRKHLHKNKTLVLLTDSHSHPAAIAQECVRANVGESRITVCEKLGYSDQNVETFFAHQLQDSERAFDSLNVVLVEVSGQQALLPSTPGFPDDLYVTDKGQGKGMITKREVRLAILSYLGAEEGDVIWDVGAGCGGVSIELAYWNARAQIYAIEHHPERFNCLKRNQEKFGVAQNLTLIQGRAPASLELLPVPDRIFIGGSDGELGELLRVNWDSLPEHGVLLLSSVTDTTQLEAMNFTNIREVADDAELESVTIQVARSETLAGSKMRKPALPVTLWRYQKRVSAQK
ncbi:bifunctional cobalt-precorrin-7 (C(5))-methyltransferase/cobalt-precorrin-6B (C(15))-methyltransferase [Marinomonas mediterranea]|jgi:precorrin-6y C5,15-methyltransferase (decarboxylating), CbiE subunit/precorrin-6Y C5,15-methyltransferase (decarboxylating), CbiT subunit|uniref:Precorrin-6y C5,15-methyltransferase (Decarboxylating), CbiE subunit n=1 Tax=Marinomonas mediterranea (strain ATCC 700492 / JCM 21426 / NBRC 103028 / MMB-1) TaxID=717774 RepID=F2JUU8_MARM1|nr:bifunctional cobalt-precorrin-7 (C(5))-methyltransferase/cobalt-precorrin-6B (C(15))-methyltransferase [Marinomonas mediterranea]ADZ90513.1 precorrin-6y C5,15-methyltransferase (decarboxylating), CbiE subunit [Marinomonas mediterranea MMB-1]WCN16692.1 bifunctional cobalt-precorrin-7 (C(5))-methyltransferase/cobalt-precorrin-6B (C(15))-methyltransferase [Marinomonas mediterranea MMB-1]